MDVLGAATRGRCTASAVLGRLRVEGANAPAPTASAKMETLRIVVRCSLRLLWVISGLAHAVFVSCNLHSVSLFTSNNPGRRPDASFWHCETCLDMYGGRVRFFRKLVTAIRP